MFRWQEAANLETEAIWLEVCRIDSPLERLAAARTLKPIKGHSGASSVCAERFLSLDRSRLKVASGTAWAFGREHVAEMTSRLRELAALFKGSATLKFLCWSCLIPMAITCERGRSVAEPMCKPMRPDLADAAWPLSASQSMRPCTSCTDRSPDAACASVAL
jgi:hypothetical protein